jgi:hypothetical protein
MKSIERGAAAVSLGAMAASPLAAGADAAASLGVVETLPRGHKR